MNPHSSIWNWIMIPIFVVGFGAMCAFVWSAFHEYLYKGDLNRVEGEKTKNKIKSAIALIVIVWLLGFALFGGN